MNLNIVKRQNTTLACASTYFSATMKPDGMLMLSTDMKDALIKNLSS